MSDNDVDDEPTRATVVDPNDRDDGDATDDSGVAVAVAAASCASPGDGPRAEESTNDDDDDDDATRRSPSTTTIITDDASITAGNRDEETSTEVKGSDEESPSSLSLSPSPSPNPDDSNAALDVVAVDDGVATTAVGRSTNRDETETPTASDAPSHEPTRATFSANVDDGSDVAGAVANDETCSSTTRRNVASNPAVGSTNDDERGVPVEPTDVERRADDERVAPTRNNNNHNHDDDDGDVPTSDPSSASTNAEPSETADEEHASVNGRDTVHDAGAEREDDADGAKKRRDERATTSTPPSDRPSVETRRDVDIVRRADVGRDAARVALVENDVVTLRRSNVTRPSVVSPTPHRPDVVPPRESSPPPVRKTVALVHSADYTRLLRSVTEYVHKDRDVLLASLLECCEFITTTTAVAQSKDGDDVVITRNHPSKPFLRVVPPMRATFEHLSHFHTKDYLSVLRSGNLKRRRVRFADEGDDDDHDDSSLEALERYGLVDDCPLPDTPEARRDLWEYCRRNAGGSLTASHLLTNATNAVDVAVHWGGGRHHARPSRAAGFCYVNDVALAIRHARHNLRAADDRDGRVLYLDVDVHHGDAVQEAFYRDDDVLTCSFHRYAPGLFPHGTGSAAHRGDGDGLGHAVNVPLPAGTGDADFFDVASSAAAALADAFRPACVVLCVGADGLRRDPLLRAAGDEGWNLTERGLASYVAFVAREVCGGDDERRRLLVLGGGGYDPSRTAATQLLCTAAACDGVAPGTSDATPRDVPAHEHFHRYGPSFELWSESEQEELNEDSRTRKSRAYRDTIEEGKRAVRLAAAYIRNRRLERENARTYGDDAGCEAGEDDSSRSQAEYCWDVPSKKRKGRKRKKSGTLVRNSKHKTRAPDKVTEVT